MYLAPELIGQKNLEATAAGDVYAFGVILTEIGTRNDPYQVKNNLHRECNFNRNIRRKVLLQPTGNL